MTTPTPALLSDYIVFVDESGDHGLERIDPTYPVLVLAFCVFAKSDYGGSVIPSLVKLKFDYFGHDQVVLHEADIRKKRGIFTFLNEPAQCDRFHADLGALVAAAPFTLFAVVIDKKKLVERFPQPPHLYHLAMVKGLQAVCTYLQENGQEGRLAHFVFERRGEREDLELELEFRRASGPGSMICRGVPADIGSRAPSGCISFVRSSPIVRSTY